MVAAAHQVLAWLNTGTLQYQEEQYRFAIQVFSYWMECTLV